MSSNVYDGSDTSDRKLHIPPCANPMCRVELLFLVDKLRTNGILCEHLYKPNGLITTRFEELLKECTYTILHKCSSLLKKMPQIMGISQLQNLGLGDKLMCVILNSSTIENNKIDANSDETCEDYFSNFSHRDVSSESSLNEFVKEVKKLMETETGAVIPKPVDEQKSNTGSDPTYVPAVSDRIESVYMNIQDIDTILIQILLDRLNCAETAEREYKQYMKIVPDMFGQSTGQDLYAMAECMQATQGNCISFSFLQSYQDFRNRLDCLETQLPQTILATQTFMLQKVIPEFYNIKHVLALAQVAVCNQPVLQSRALVMLELLIFEGHGAWNKTNLVKAEQLLSETLKHVSNRHSSSEQYSLCFIQRLCNLVMLLRYTMAFHELGTNLQKASKPIRLPALYKSKAQECIDNIEHFRKKTANELLATVNEFCTVDEEEEPYSRVKKLIAKSKASHIAVIFEYLKKIFTKMSVQYLQFLKEYVCSKKNRPSECLAAIAHGLTLFLCHGLRIASDRNIQNVCLAVLTVLDAVADKDFIKETKSMLNMLIFDKRPVIRRRIIMSQFKNRSSYIKEIEQRLLTEISRMLSPILILEHKKSRTIGETNWRTTLGTCNHFPAIVLFHTPTEHDHKETNETQFTNFVDRMHIDQVKTLLALRHEFIITLFAYQITCIPQFYVLEDYVTNNLQAALKNKNDNRSYFDQTTLMSFMMCAIKALDYCHNKGIVHRNLTAESLFIVGDSKVKLAGFTLAVSLHGFEEVIVARGSSQIPTRWSAPESLSKLKFSHKSDVCMFGNMMYETFTHGALPYSHIHLSNDTFVTQITTKEIQLPRETCIMKEILEEISKCVTFEAIDRPCAVYLKERLSNLNTDALIEFKPRYPSLSDILSENVRQPATTMGKGTPEYEDVYLKKSEYVLPIEMLSPFECIQQRRNDGYVFAESVKRKISQHLQDQINSACNDIIPSCMTMSKINEELIVFEYYISSLRVSSVWDCFCNRLFGHDLHIYLTILVKIVEKLEQLHMGSFVLGNISTSSVFIDYEKEDPAVHFVSWAYINCIETYSDNAHLLGSPQKAVALAGSAPEVTTSGLYSPASDVYCFGNFLKGIVTAFIRSSDNPYKTNPNTEKAPGKFEQERKHRCLNQLMELSKECMIPDRRHRLTLDTVIHKIKNLNTQARPRFEDQPRRRDHETTLKKTLYSDSDDDSCCQVIPKRLYEKRSSVDSAFDSQSDLYSSNRAMYFTSRHAHQEHTAQESPQAMLVMETDMSSVKPCSLADNLLNIYSDASSTPAHVTQRFGDTPLTIRLKAMMPHRFSTIGEISLACSNLETYSNNELYDYTEVGEEGQYNSVDEEESNHIYETLDWENPSHKSKTNHTAFSELDIQVVETIVSQPMISDVVISNAGERNNPLCADCSNAQSSAKCEMVTRYLNAADLCHLDASASKTDDRNVVFV